MLNDFFISQIKFIRQIIQIQKVRIVNINKFIRQNNLNKKYLRYFYDYKIQMKKRSTVSKPKTKSKRQEGKKPKEETKKKIKSAVDQCEDFIMIDGNLYQAKTKTQRNSYQKYLHSMRMEHIKLNNRQNQPPVVKKPFDAEEYVRTLSKSQKMQMLKKLQDQIVPKKKVEIQEVNPFEKFQNQLDKVKTQLYFKWERQSQKIAQLYYNGAISQTQKVQKIQLLSKLKDHKMRVIDCTLNLFRKIWKSKQQDDMAQNQEEFDEIIKSLNSFSSFENIPQPEPEHIVDISVQEACNKNIENKRSLSLQQQKYFPKLQLQQSLRLSQQRQQKLQFSVQRSRQFSIQDELKLDIKQIPEKVSNIFGINRDPMIKTEQDYDLYEDISQRIQNFEQRQTYDEQKFKQNSPPNQQIQTKWQPEQKKINEIIENNIIQKVPKKHQGNNKQDLQCYEPVKKFKIPLLMTKDRAEQLQLEKRLKQLENFKDAIERRVQIQLAWIQIQGPALFTALNGINQYLLSLAEFLIKQYVDVVVDNFNTPYGLSVMYKLYNLQNSGFASPKSTENLTYMVLNQDYFENHMDEFMKERQISQYEKIHSRAIFDCFNSKLDFYRPYFQTDGQKYPWLISPQGISFYEVNQGTANDAFTQAKIRVFQPCSALCGLILQSSNIQSEQQRLLHQKRQQFQTRIIRSEMIEQLKESEIQLLNFDTLCRLLISQAILHEQLKQLSETLKNLQKW